MRWLVGLTTALLLAAIVASTVGGARSVDGGPGRRSSPVTAGGLPTSVPPPTSVPAAPDATAASPGSSATTSSAPNEAEPTSSTSAGYTAAQVAEHANADSCWLIVAGQVYDVSAYLEQHPGGAETITPWCGRESTEAYETEGGEGEHSDRAGDLLAGYRIGELVA